MSILPIIEARDPNFNAYNHYKVSTKRGMKNAAKYDWATKVQTAFIVANYITANPA